MECLCVTECTIRSNGKSVHVEKGRILDFEKCPKHHFQPLHAAVIDFDKATEELLLRSRNWEVMEALEYLEDELEYKYTGPPLSREAAAQLVVDVRTRRVVLPTGE